MYIVYTDFTELPYTSLDRYFVSQNAQYGIYGEGRHSSL